MFNSFRISFISKIAAGTGLALLLFAGAAVADAFEVQPARLSLSAKQPTAKVQISNPGQEDMILRFQVSDWSQEHGRDQFTPSRGLLVHPQQVTLRPGSSTTVSIVLRLSAPTWTEDAYRVLVSEVPRPTDVGSVNPAPSKRRAITELSLPVFVLPPGTAQPRLHWRIQRNRMGEVELHASNRGTAHVQLQAASLQGPSGQSIRKNDMTAYVLPGADRAWPLAGDPQAGVWRLTADTNAGPMQVDIKFEPDAAPMSTLAIGR